MIDDNRPASEILERFRIISELVADFAYTCCVAADGSLAVEWATDSFAEVIGFSSAEINQRGWQGLIHPDDLPLIHEQFTRLRAGESSVAELRILVKSGETRWVRNYARPVLDEQRRLVRIHGAAQDITRRKQTDDELRQNEERFKLAVSGAPLTLFEQDLDLKYRWLYPNRVEFPTDNLGHSDADLVPPEDAQVLTRLKQEVIERGVALRQEIRATLPGEARWYDLVIEPKRDSDGNIVGIAGAAFDITDRKQAEARLRESEERFAKAFNANPDPMTIHRISDGRYIAANDSFLSVTGFSRDEVIGRTASELNLVVADDHRQEWGQRLREQGAFHNLEAVYRTRLGEIRTALMSAEIIDVGGEPCVLAVSTDITERKHAEETIRTLLRVSERLNSTLDVEELLDILVQEALKLVNAESGVAGLRTPEGMVCHRYLKRGEPMELEYCWPPGHGLPGWLLIHKVPYLTNEAMADPQIVHELCRQFGVWAALSTPVLDTRGNVIGFFEIHNKRDGTGFTASDQEQLLAVSQAAAIAIQNALAYRAVQQAEEERAALLAREQALRFEAEQANRLKDEFLATISHELRTPLNAILGWVGMLRGGKLDQDMAARALETIERNGKSQAKIIEDLLDISRIITGKLRLNVQPVELSSVVEAALDVVRPAADAKEIRLEVILDPHAGPVSGDPERLQQVVWNLLSNAIKFTPKEGRVQVRLARQDSHVTLSVSDNGKGISGEFMPYVFDRFRQAEAGFTRMHGGLGLGLAIVRHLTELHGGSANALSEGEGRGATFTISLPVMSVRSSRLRTSKRPAPAELPAPVNALLDCPPSLTGLHLLIVEDDPDARLLLQAMLEQCEAEVQTAESAAKALRLLDEWPPDLLISDIEMPREDGYSLIRKVRSRGRPQGQRLPAIALTAHARAEDRVRALTAGFDAHVAKPVEAAELVTVILSLARMSGKS
jgi:PAS domain S-box-containing protein